jgi:hypothetical protein
MKHVASERYARRSGYRLGVRILQLRRVGLESELGVKAGSLVE